MSKGLSKNKLPNIILIVCDTLGAKHMSLYGYHRKTTPNLERMVEEEGFTVYNRCFSTSNWTPPAYASILTGLYPSEHGVNEENQYLSEHLILLPEVLKGMGYKTIGISCNGLIGHPTGFSRGFDIFLELERWILFYKPSNIIKKVLNSLWYQLRASNKGRSGVLRNATLFTEKALNKAKEFFTNSEKPLFIFINLMQTHHRYNPPNGYKGIWSSDFLYNTYKRHTHDYFLHYIRPFSEQAKKYLEALYDEEVLFLDSVLSDFYRFLKRRGYEENLLFIITSDHGESFGEFNLMGHNFSLLNQIVWVPLLIKYPDKFNLSYNQINGIAQINDIYATILEVVKSPYPTNDSSFSLISQKREYAKMEVIKPQAFFSHLKKLNPKFKHSDFIYRYPLEARVNSNFEKIVMIQMGRETKMEYYDIRDMRNETLKRVSIMPKNN